MEMKWIFIFYKIKYQEEKDIIYLIKSNQYIVPTDGKPIRGLLQDSIDSKVKIDKNLFKNYSQKNLNKVKENNIYNNSYDLIEKLRKKIWKCYFKRINIGYKCRYSS